MGAHGVSKRKRGTRTRVQHANTSAARGRRRGSRAPRGHGHTGTPAHGASKPHDDSAVCERDDILSRQHARDTGAPSDDARTPADAIDRPTRRTAAGSVQGQLPLATRAGNSDRSAVVRSVGGPWSAEREKRVGSATVRAATANSSRLRSYPCAAGHAGHQGHPSYLSSNYVRKLLFVARLNGSNQLGWW